MANGAKPNGPLAADQTLHPVIANPRRVAVIGVHGVAHHDPGETANAMADLLLSLPPFKPQEAGTPCENQPSREFEHFDSKGLQIPLRPVCVDKEERVVVERNQIVPGPFRLQEGSYKFAMHLADKAKKKELVKDRGEVGRQWSVKLLQDYYGAGDSNKYVTTRLEGRRTKDSTEVHIYEMFWADLAHPTNSILSFLLALFQFILHVPSLSRLAIDSRPNPDRIWRVFQALHRYASRMLQMALPLAKVVLLIVLSVAIPAVTTVQHLDVLSSVVSGVVVAIAGFLLMNYKLKPAFKSRTGWLVASFSIPALVTAGLLAYFHRLDIVQEQINIHKHTPGVQADKGLEVVILAIAIWALGAALMQWALRAYQSTRPGIQGWGWTAYGLALIGFGISSYYAWQENAHTSIWVQQASFWSVQWILALVRLSWIGLALLAISSSILGAIAWRRAGTPNEKSKARAAARTSRFALAMPSFLFVLVTSLIWSALFSIGQKVHDPFYAPGVVKNPARHPHQDWMDNFDLFPKQSIADGFPQDCQDPKPICSGTQQKTCSCSTETQPDYLKGVLAWSVGSGSYMVVLVTLAGLIVLIWWALPSVFTERFPPRRDYGWYVKHGTEPPRNSTNHDAMWMGAWTSRGLDSISLVTWLCWSAIFLIPLAFMYLGSPHWFGLRAHSELVTKLVVCRVMAVASTTAILATLVHYSSPVLRVILDVDTYMRTGPIEGTPRAKIFERYVSLLRHIAQYRGPDGRGYDRVVIVAHSLGALISGDLLNLLQHQKNDPALQRLGYWRDQNETKIPIRLFTMGNPVRQLLNRFFPYLYDWVRDDPDNGSNPLQPPLEKPPARIDAPLPDPADLGLEKWVSAYRSGDYVGRSLWLTEWYRRTEKCDKDGTYPEEIKKISDTDEIRVEFCIGAGAHTHYWDDTAPDIAEELNNLI
jgi:hypothetical protein